MTDMRLGLDAGAYTLDVALERGIKGIPIFVDQLVRDGVQATLAPLQERGLEVCQVGAFGYNPLAPDRVQQKQLLQKAIPLVVETGCPYLVICGGNYHPSGFGALDARNFKADALDEIARELSPLITLAEQHGVKLSIEPYLKTAICNPERFLALWDKVGSDALRVNIDVTSLYTFWDLVDATETVQHICTALAGHYGLVHIKEVALSEGFHIHSGLAPLGEGVTDWAQVLHLVSLHLPQDSWVILEHVATAEEAHTSLDLLRDAALKAGVLLA
jgi:sugar phosphate isomerase/epimerase